jgi:hypothetical protein
VGAFHARIFCAVLVSSFCIAKFIITFFAGFEVFRVICMRMAVFWVVALCSLVEVYHSFRGACCFHHQGDDGSRKDL